MIRQSNIILIIVALACLSSCSLAIILSDIGQIVSSAIDIEEELVIHH
jgi:hypothetical protein